jgi:threonine/homoserine/homoserine lactone efflux protein
MDVLILLKGLTLGFTIAAPVGPIGVLCIRNTLTKGRNYGLATGLGAATADASYGFIAAFGLTFISNFLISLQFWIKLIGGLFLCYLGIKTLLTPPAENAAKVSGRGLLGTYGSTVFLTLTNPATILSFAAVFASVGIGTDNGGYLSAAILVIGVFLGSALWWLILSGGVNLFRSHFRPGVLVWVNRLSGLMIIIFGLLAIGSLFL